MSNDTRMLPVEPRYPVKLRAIVLKAREARFAAALQGDEL
jgi:hypothetical protein